MLSGSNWRKLAAVKVIDGSTSTVSDDDARHLYTSQTSTTCHISLTEIVARANTEINEVISKSRFFAARSDKFSNFYSLYISVCSFLARDVIYRPTSRAYATMSVRPRPEPHVDRFGHFCTATRSVINGQTTLRACAICNNSPQHSLRMWLPLMLQLDGDFIRTVFYR